MAEDDDDCVVECEPVEVSLPRLKVAPDFLGKIKQSHPSPLTAWGDLIDNSREAGATVLDISVRSGPAQGWSWKHDLIVSSDNGCGMTESKMSEGLMGIGYTQKDLSTGQHYGFGSTTSIPRIADNALILSINADGERTVGFISTQLAAQLGATELITPQCTWARARAGGFEILQRDEHKYSLNYASRLASLKIINDHSPFLTEEQLLAEFGRLAARGRTGTTVVMWNVSSEHDLKKDDDIALRGQERSTWPHVRSLRGYLELLYYCDDDNVPRMAISIKGSPVVPRNWTRFLHHRHTDQHRHREEGGAMLGEFYRPEKDRPTCHITFGYQVSLEQLVAVFSDRKVGKKKVDSENMRLQEYSGAFYYHRDRLIVPLRRFSCQQKTITQMLTTERRIKTLGFGLLAVCRENYLTAGHNKSHYVATDATDDRKMPPAAQLFKILSEKAEKHLATRISPLLDRAMGRIAPAAPGSSSDPTAPRGDAASGDVDAGAPKGPRSPVDKAAALEAQQAEAAAARAIVPDAWMLASDGRAGRVVLCDRGWFMLRDNDGSVGVRRYRALQLRTESFDPLLHQQLPAPLGPMLGGTIEIWWRLDDEPSRFYGGALVESKTHPGRPGHFLVWYAGTPRDDEDNEELYISVRPNGSAVVFRTREGEQLSKDEVRLDEQRLQRAASIAFGGDKPDGGLAAPAPMPSVQQTEDPSHVRLDPSHVRLDPLHVRPVVTASAPNQEQLVQKLQTEVHQSREQLKQANAQADLLQAELAAVRLAEAKAQMKAQLLEKQQREAELARQAEAQAKARRAEEDRERQSRESCEREQRERQARQQRERQAQEQRDRELRERREKQIADEQQRKTGAQQGDMDRATVVAPPSALVESGSLTDMSSKALRARESELNRQLLEVRALLKASRDAPAAKSSEPCSDEPSLPAVARQQPPAGQPMLAASAATGTPAKRDRPVTAPPASASSPRPGIAPEATTGEFRPGWLGRVAVTWVGGRAKGAIFEGTVQRWSTEIAYRGGLEHVYEIAYDDGQTSWHGFADPKKRVAVLPPQPKRGELRQRGSWQPLDLTCPLSEKRLAHPSRGPLCRHPPACNFEPLKDHVRKHKKCPCDGCDVALSNPREVQLDDALQLELTCIPSAIARVWINGEGHVKITDPNRPAELAPGAALDGPPVPRAKRARQEGSAEV